MLPAQYSCTAKRNDGPTLPDVAPLCYNSAMDKITLKNYRCFREEQTARLAPLTFLVGENSTGKTSFLALIRALWDVAFRDEVPDFREDPYNLGSFNEIVHSRSGRGGRANSFEAGFDDSRNRRRGSISFHAEFEARSSDPFPAVRCYKKDGATIEVCDQGTGQHSVGLSQLETDGSSIKKYSTVEASLFSRDETRLAPLRSLEMEYRRNIVESEIPEAADGRITRGRVGTGSHRIRESQVGPEALDIFRETVNSFRMPVTPRLTRVRPYAGAPVRSRPLRTYDPARPSADPEGGYIPTYLASLFHRNPDSWQELKRSLEGFGRASGLFDEIAIKLLGRSEGTPFQVQIRKFSSKGRKGPHRNLIDVGYGVSQALPLLSELLRSDASQMFLLQQPEVHLHPIAQAALGSLFCELAGQRRQLIVETHSDYILDRVRMDIRDKKSAFGPDDVSILYFEPGDLDVKIHSIRLDEYGNVLDAPIGYRKFFMEETSRSIGIGL